MSLFESFPDSPRAALRPARRWPTIGLAAALFCSQLARAERAQAEPARDASEAENAEHLFQQGLQGMLAKEYDTACPRLAASYQRDPLPGVLFTLAECEAGWKKLATALGHYQAFVSALTSMTADRRATFEERRQIAAGQIAVLSVSAPELTVDVPAHPPRNLVVKCDGLLIPEGSYGVGRRVDPGTHEVFAEVDGNRVWERQLTLEPDNHARITVAVSAGVAANSAPDPQGADARAGVIHSRHKPLGTWVYVAGGVAITGLATGLISGFLALEQKGAIDRNCPDLRCNSEGRSVLDSARAEAAVSTVGFTFGVLGAGATALLLLLPPRSAPPTQSNRTGGSKSTWRIESDGKTIGLAGQF